MKRIILTMLIIAATGNVLANTSVWPLDVGQTWLYERTDAVSGPWQVNLDVLSKQTLGAYEYYQARISNYDNQGESEDWYIRSTDTGVYTWDGSADQLTFQIAPIGTVIINGDTQRELVAIESVTVPYGGPYQAYKYENQDTVEMSPYWYEYIVPGIGIVQQIDYWADTGLGQVAPLEQKLVNIEGFISGSGTEADPYLIEDVNDLGVFANPANAGKYWANGVHTMLTRDLDLFGRIYSSAVIAPDTDGTNNTYQGTAFRGVFDGNDFTISNLTIDASTSGNDYLGLFGYINGGSVTNLSFVDVHITGSNSSLEVGALAGHVQGHLQSEPVEISNCHSTGTIEGRSRLGGLIGNKSLSSSISDCSSSATITSLLNSLDGSSIGGLVGSSSEGQISNCQSSGNVDGYANVGGLIGHAGYTQIIDCHASGSVTGNRDSGGLVGSCSAGAIRNSFALGDVTCVNFYIGGLVGFTWYNTSITNSYAMGDVSATNEVGGLVGHYEGGSIRDCYAAGEVDGSFDVGGLIGVNNGGVQTGCFWDVDTSGMTDGVGDEDPDPAGVTGKTTGEMKTAGTFLDAGWDMVTVWNIEEVQTYPLLRKYSAVDTNYDNRIDLVDFMEFAGHWLDGVE